MALLPAKTQIRPPHSSASPHRVLKLAYEMKLKDNRPLRIFLYVHSHLSMAEKHSFSHLCKYKTINRSMQGYSYVFLPTQLLGMW